MSEAAETKNADGAEPITIRVRDQVRTIGLETVRLSAPSVTLCVFGAPALTSV
jgi:hypothetical protein